MGGVERELMWVVGEISESLASTCHFLIIEFLERVQGEDGEVRHIFNWDGNTEDLVTLFSALSFRHPETSWHFYYSENRNGFMFDATIEFRNGVGERRLETWDSGLYSFYKELGDTEIEPDDVEAVYCVDDLDGVASEIKVWLQSVNGWVNIPIKTATVPLESP